jgi:hypothetical protein
MMAVSVATHPRLNIGSPRVLFEPGFRNSVPLRSYDVSADGRHFLMNQPMPDRPAVAQQMILVQNWFEELKARVPTK